MSQCVCKRPTNRKETVILVECDIIEACHFRGVRMPVDEAQCYREVDNVTAPPSVSYSPRRARLSASYPRRRASLLRALI